jgi:predicted porin
MRQILILSPLLALACVTNSHAQEAGGSSPSLALGALSLTPFGQVDQFVGRSSGYGNDASPGAAPGQPAKVDLLNGGLSTSNIGLKGKARISDSTDVTFELSAFINPEGASFGRSGDKSVSIAGATFGADPLFSRAANIGFHEKDLGTLKIGTDVTPLFFGAIKSNAFGDSTVFGPLAAVMFINSGLSGGTNWQKGVFLDSGVVGGFSARLAYSFGDEGSAYVSPAAANDAEAHSGRNYGASVNYAGGGFAAVASYQKVDRDQVIGNFSTSGLSVDNTTAWLAGVSYDFGVARVFAHVGGIRDDSSASSPFYTGDQKLYELSLSVPAGPGELLLGVARRSVSGSVAPTPDIAIAADGAPGGNAGRRLATIGYDYHLFKSTDLYALLSSDSTRTNTVDTTNGNVGIHTASPVDFALGARFSF